MVAPRIGAGLNGEKAILALFICEAASGSGEIRIQRRVVLIYLMMVAPGRIGLPDLDERVWHGALVFVQHPADDNQPFTHCLAPGAGVAREIVVARLHRIVPEERTRDLGEGLFHRHQPLQRRALHRRLIAFVKIGRMGFPIARFVGLDLHRTTTSWFYLLSLSSSL